MSQFSFEIANVQSFVSPARCGARVIYIGRENQYLGLQGSPLANPFPISSKLLRIPCIAKYRTWLFDQIAAKSVPVIMELERIHAWAVTHGVVLLCWCHPKPCHASVVIEAVRSLEVAP